MKDEINYEEGLSSCCGAKVYLDIGICSDCKEHCDVEEPEPDEEDLDLKNK